MTAAELIAQITDAAQRAGVPLDLLEVDELDGAHGIEVVAGRWLSLGLPEPEFEVDL